MEILFIVGRILLGGFLLMNAYNHLANANALTGYAQSKGAPMPKLSVIVTGLMLLVGGYSVLTGMHVELGVTLVAIFLVLSSFVMHPYWKSEGQESAMEKVQFMKNMAILGAMLMLLAIPLPWVYTFGI